MKSHPGRLVRHHLLLAALLPSALAGQQGDAPSASDVFFDRLDVEVVNVEVYVTDKDGRSVSGLTAADFEVFEDGVPQEITHFYSVENSRAVMPAPETAPLLACSCHPLHKHIIFRGLRAASKSISLQWAVVEAMDASQPAPWGVMRQGRCRT